MFSNSMMQSTLLGSVVDTTYVNSCIATKSHDLSDAKT
jgi:hypothetical protein